MEQFTQSPSSGEGVAAEDPSLSTDELNVMHYAGGYAPHSLLKRYMKREYDQFIECLGVTWQLKVGTATSSVTPRSGLRSKPWRIVPSKYDLPFL